MESYAPSDIRTIVLCGHGGAGKTILAEAMLLKAGMVNRIGSIADGTTVSDYEEDEQERGCSVSSSVLHGKFADKQIRIIDTPGSSGFIGSVVSGIAAADLAVICINASKGIELMSRKAWDLAGEMNVPRMIVVTRMDGDNVNYQELLKNIKESFGKACVAFTLPEGEGASFAGVTAVMDEKNTGEAAGAQRMEITESAVESDDALMEKYLEGEEITHAQVMDLLQNAIAGGSVVPVFAVAAEKEVGVEELMNGIAAWAPEPMQARRTVVKGEGEERVEEIWSPQPDGPLAAQVFKIVSDPHVGKLAFFRVFQGELASKSSALVSSTGKAEKFAQIFIAQGEKREDLDKAVAGDVAVVAKVDALHAGDTIYAQGFEGRFKKLPFPTPMAGLAISPKSRGDEQKMSTNLQRLCEEDPTFLFERNELTNEQVVRGTSKLHLDVMLGRLKRRFGLEVDTKPPKIPYLETITGSAEGSYRHKKQTGGAGQFAEVHIRLKPNERGAGFEFVNAIVGGVISGSFIPSVEKGIRKAMDKGPVAGYPVVDVVAELFFGKEHPVDSKDIAFQIAGEQAFKEISQKCKPVLLEPVVNMEIVAPVQYTGDISGDIATRRGRPTGMEQMGALQVLKAQVPLAEVMDYGSTLSAISQGEGDYGMELSHYESVPGNVAEQVVAKAKAMAEAEH